MSGRKRTMALRRWAQWLRPPSWLSIGASRRKTSPEICPERFDQGGASGTLSSPDEAMQLPISEEALKNKAGQIVDHPMEFDEFWQ